MSYRLSKITTRTGDDGSTGLGDGTRRPKNHARVEVLGNIDELSSTLGVLLTEPIADNIAAKLRMVQNDLFDLGGELSIPTHRIVGASHLLGLDEAITEFNAGLAPLKEFILPGGCRAAASCHVARTVCRRAERSVVALAQVDDVSPLAVHYLNRLSDLLFVLARMLNHNAGVADTLWQRQP
jgi:cob(I)alamin adenosyltransferase